MLSIQIEGGHEVKKVLPLIAMALGLGLLSGASVPAGAAFPGENGRILFLSSRGTAGMDSEIFTMKPDGSGVRMLTDNASPESYSCWSPDGSRIAFTMVPDGEFDNEVFTMKADGTDVERITEDAHTDFDPCWSPDGEKLVYSSLRGDSNEYSYIFKVPSDGSADPKRISPQESNHSAPVWGTSGLIAVDRYDGNDLEIMTMKPDGSQRENLTSNSVTDFTPDWSPDGNKLAFVRIFDFDTEDENYEVFTIRPSGDGAKNVTTSPEKNEARPAWSPSGTRIVFNQDADGSSDLATIKPDGTGRKNLTKDDPAEAYWPDWQPKP
jgi:TolB protein